MLLSTFTMDYADSGIVYTLLSDDGSIYSPKSIASYYNLFPFK